MDTTVPMDFDNKDSTDYMAPFIGEVDTYEIPPQPSDMPIVYNPCDPIVGKSRTPRNKPCPCGSGRKYKRCCGER